MVNSLRWFAIILCGLLASCYNDDRLYFTAMPDASVDASMDVGSQDIGLADAGPDDSGDATDGSIYMPPPPFPDAGSTGTCVLPTAGKNVPCIRWMPQGSCWFLSDLPGSDWDQMCEDGLPMGGWCQCLGDDWGSEQGLDLGPDKLPCCQRPF